MKIAISTDNGKVSPHFGRCPQFTIIEIEDNKIISKKVIDNPGHTPGYLPEFLGKAGAGTIIAGGMGNMAQELFKKAKIEAILGIQGTIDEVLEKMLAGKLEGIETICDPGAGKGYGLDKEECEHEKEE